MKRMLGKSLSLLLVLAMAFTLLAPASAVELPDSGDLTGKLVILHTNDTHGRDLEGTYTTAAVSQLKKDYEAAGANVLLLSAGDATQGTPLVNMEQGKLAIQFMNAAGYDAMSPGNHEFDWGTENLKTILEEADFPVLAANVLDAATGEPMFQANQIFEFEGLKVGVFGLDTPEAATKAHPDKVRGTQFLAGEEMFAVAQAQVDELEAAECDVIICLGHLGDSDESIGNRSIDVLEAVEGIDLFIDGHSHTTLETGMVTNGTLRVSTGEYLDHIGVVIYDGETFTAGLLGADEEGNLEYTGSDETLLALMEEENAQVEEALSATFGSTEVVLDGERDPGVRTQETNLGDFAADAILWAARDYLGEDKVDVALTNGGGIRASIPVGEISMKTMNTVFPFGNEVATITVTGAELLEALEAATCTTPDAIGAFPQVAGMSFTIDTTVPYENGAQYEGSTYYAPARPGSRITQLEINGEPVDLEKEYVVATNDFTAAGGDTYGVFVGKSITKTGLLLDEALVNYTQQVLGGVITAEQYGQSAGRITIIKDALADFSDVDTSSWYADAVRYCVENALMNGTGDGNFAPNGTVTRGTVFQTLYNAAGKPEVGGTSFVDVEGKWYADAAAWAESAGLATVPEDRTFNGDRAITRAEIATIFTRYAQYSGMVTSRGDLSNFVDADQVSDWAVEGMEIAVGSGIISGKDGSRLDPNGTAVRTELATILMNYSKLVPAEEQAA